ncbi:hypothetical protein QJQ45_002598 [Haematococcus lacustris]|nr:hypothetical protein QJQ45_002598 [Haematococcus lacustris]
MAELSMQRHGHAKQLVVFFGAAGIGPKGGPDVVPGSGHAQAPTGPMQPGSHTASEPGPSSPWPAKRSKRTKAEQAAEPTQPTKGKGKAKGKAAKRIGESSWRPLELCWWSDLPAKGKEHPGLCYKRLRDKPPKAQQLQPSEAQ